MTHRYWIAIACSLVTSACGASQTSSPTNVAAPAQPSPEPSPATAAAASATAPSTGETAPPAATGEEAHRLVVAAVACWLGGVWSDAEGASEEARAADAERRCHELVTRIHGTDDKARYERLRAVEAAEVSDVKAKILDVARKDPVDARRVQQLGSLFDAAADAQRETMTARRAADRVKKDIEGERQPGKLTEDEVAAVAPLSESKAFDALVNIDLGDLTREARAIAILCAMDRMETARGLPKHLKVYVLEEPFRVYFGVAAPDVPRDARTPLKGGAWLAYITSVANAAGHPVPDRAKSLADRELLAWGGAFEGLADKLRTEADALSDATELKRVSQAVVRRLDIEYRASDTAARREPEPAGPPRHLGKPNR